MVDFIIVAHGSFADGLKESSFMLFGEQDFVKTIALTPDMDQNGLEQKITQVYDSSKPTLFLVDLYGGTPFNVCAKIQAANSESTAVIAGVNVPLLLEAYGNNSDVATPESIKNEILKIAPETIVGLPESKQNNLSVQATIVDPDLFNSKQALEQIKNSGADRVLVITADVNNRSDIKKSASENGVTQKVNVISPEKFAQISSDVKLQNINFILLSDHKF